MNRSLQPMRTPIRCATCCSDCLILTNNFPPTLGGAGEVYAALASAAAGRIRILCASHSYSGGEEIPGWRLHDRAASYPIDRVTQVRPLLHPRGRRVAQIAGELWLRARLLLRLGWLRWRHRFRALCIADDESVGWLIRPAQMLLRCRVLLYSHGDDLAERAGEARLRARRRRQFAQADAIVAVSEACAQALGRVFGVPRERVTVIRNGIDTALFRPQAPDVTLRDSLGLAGRRVIVTVSRLIPRKGVDRVIEAMPQLLRVVPNLVYLVVGDGPQAAELRALAERLGVAERVRFTGAVPHAAVPSYLALAELMAMPNRRMPDGEEDGLSLIFLEANACGLPVIAGCSGGAPEVVADGANGLLVDGDDAGAVTDAITRVLTDAALAQKLAADGLRRAASADWQRSSEEFLRLCG